MSLNEAREAYKKRKADSLRYTIWRKWSIVLQKK